MKSPVVKRSIVVAGHKTSVSLEEAFWNGMKEISGLRNMTLSELVGEIGDTAVRPGLFQEPLDWRATVGLEGAQRTSAAAITAKGWKPAKKGRAHFGEARPFRFNRR